MEDCGLYLDFSRQRIDADGLRLLTGLADACGLRGAIDSMWRGDVINATEGRAVLHTALRVPRASEAGPGGIDIARQVLAERERSGGVVGVTVVAGSGVDADAHGASSRGGARILARQR